MVGKPSRRARRNHAPRENGAGAEAQAQQAQVKLRLEYRELLGDYTRDIAEMCELARLAMLHASRALGGQDLEAAENAMTESDKLIDVHLRCEDRAMLLLSRQNPVATDLRQVLAYIHMERNLTRMGNLAKLVAKIARQHHPSPALPDDVLADIIDMAQLCDQMAARAAALIATPKVKDALDLVTEDEPIDAAARSLTAEASGEDWPYTNRDAVETALICRYYERFADHCVDIGRHIIFMVTSMRPNELPEFCSPAQAEELAELERRFSLRM